MQDQTGNWNEYAVMVESSVAIGETEPSTFDFVEKCINAAEVALKKNKMESSSIPIRNKSKSFQTENMNHLKKF